MHELIRYKTWLQEPSLDAQTRAELQAIADNPDEIKLRFGSELAFGTAGLRGVMRAAPEIRPFPAPRHVPRHGA